MNDNRRKMCIALVAHVDAGKTTLSESMLFESGKIRKLGRVDNRDAYLDTHEMERERGITIFSKQAMFSYEDIDFTLLDTPGHVDFSAEMERTLQVLDYAVLVIAAPDGIQGHTRTLWRLLRQYKIPTFIFVNKMDQEGQDKDESLQLLKAKLDDSCVDFSIEDEAFYENVSVLDERLMENYLEGKEITVDDISKLIVDRKLFPVFFGSALKDQGVKELLEGLKRYAQNPVYGDKFGAKVFKIARDEQGNRMTYLKITGGELSVKDILRNAQNDYQQKEEVWEEKVNQIRLYSGLKYEAVSSIGAGSVCAVLGLSKTYPGEGLGEELNSESPILEPVLKYRVILPDDVDANSMLPKLRLLEEEEPQLHVLWDEELKELQVQLMGEVQIEILKRLINDRFQIAVEFGEGNIVYKETIANIVEGVGHFEPLRHYAEVHLKLEPAENGSGLTFATDCSEDILARNWQRLIMTHLEEKIHKGVLTGAAITDIKITITSGRAHLKHTEGGDFRQATYRAVRQGLMKAQSVLLEPFYSFRLELPSEMVGRAMTDLEQKHAKLDAPDMEGNMSVLTGSLPVSCLGTYQKDVIAYTRGRGRLSCTLLGYFPCHNTEEVIEKKGYMPELDVRNSPDSVFCAHGAGFVVPWNEVEAYMHVESNGIYEQQDWLQEDNNDFSNENIYKARGKRTEKAEEVFLGTEEIDDILAKTYHANRKENPKIWKKTAGKKPSQSIGPILKEWNPSPQKENYLLVDGYNVIFAWQELNELANINIDGARGKLLDILCNYQAIKKCHLIVVFDAYRIQGHKTEYYDYHNIHVVFTKEAETADQYIEKFAHENSKKYNVRVATSDGLEQIIIRGQGCQLVSAREFEKEVERTAAEIRDNYLEQPQKSGMTLKDLKVFDEL